MTADTVQQTTDYQNLASLYWLGFLLTGNQDRSALIAIEAFEVYDDPSVIRRAIIEKALAEVCEEARPAVSVCSLPCRDIDCELLTRALFELDLFARRILVLTVYEGYSAREAARQLACDIGTLTAARTTALCRLTGLLLLPESVPSIE